MTLPGPHPDPLAEFEAGRISAPVALARLLLAGHDSAAIRARLADTPASPLHALIADRDATLDHLASAFRGAAVDPADFPGPGDPVSRIAAFFDRAATASPEAGVAFYSLGDPALLAAATDEIAAWLHATGLLRPGMDVLDLGCGIGRLLPTLAATARSVLGLEISPRMLAEARARHPTLRIEHTDGRNLDALAPESLDLVLAVDSFPYIVAAGPTVLAAHTGGIARALRPGGHLALLNFSYRGNPAQDAADAATFPGLKLVTADARPFQLWDGAAYLLRKPTVEIVHLADRPDLAPIVAGWTWDAFWRGHGYTLDEVLARTRAGTSRHGTPQTFIALVDGDPAATASLAAHDLDERPDLTPWLAGVFTHTGHRGQDLATRLVHRVEQAASEAGHDHIWLYTSRAEGLYARLGWTTTERIPRPSNPQTPIMRKQLTQPG